MGLVAAPQAPPGADGRGLRTSRRRRGPKAPPGPPPPPLPSGVLTTIWVLASLSALAAWFLLYAFVLSGLQEARSQHALYADLRSELAQATAPPIRVGQSPSDNIPLGAPVAILRVAQAGIDDVVLAGTTSGALERGPGLRQDTPLPGQAGVSVIYGRQAMFGGPFRHLASLRRGDLVLVTTGQGVFTYVVHDLRYPGDPRPSPPAPGQSRLILETAVGSGSSGAWEPSRLLYVDATLRGKTVASPAGLPTEVPPSEMPMHWDGSVLTSLVLWLQLLLAATVTVVWARSKWGAWQTWLVAAPTILGMLWIVTDTAFQLLPNLL